MARAKAKDRTPAEQAKHDVKVEAKKLQRTNLAKLIVLIGEAFVDGTDGTVSEEMADLALSLKKAPRTAGITGVKAVVIRMFSDIGDTVDEDSIWSENKLGRAEMRKTTVNLIKKEKPGERLWISFNPEKGVYTLEGMGADAPSGWTGYTPVKVEDIEIM